MNSMRTGMCSLDAVPMFWFDATDGGIRIRPPALGRWRRLRPAGTGMRKFRCRGSPLRGCIFVEVNRDFLCQSRMEHVSRGRSSESHAMAFLHLYRLQTCSSATEECLKIA